MSAPFLESQRLAFRQPDRNFAAQVFNRLTSDAEVTRYVGWARHTAVAQTAAVLEVFGAHWQTHGFGPLLIEERASRTLLGSTGLTRDDDGQVSTGYVLARDAWGRGYATEALGVVVAWARSLHLPMLRAKCHGGHLASQRVLTKCGFSLIEELPRSMHFPNFGETALQDVSVFALALPSRLGE
jgi:[ribosomal protein S5]-alanine N-acetyltransferase